MPNEKQDEMKVEVSVSHSASANLVLVYLEIQKKRIEILIEDELPWNRSEKMSFEQFLNGDY